MIGSTDDHSWGLWQKWQDDIMEAILAAEAAGAGCGRKIGPFPCCSVVQGDCLELMKQLCGDVAIVSDPPYGMDYDTNGSRFTLGGRTLSPVHGDDKPFDPSPWLGFAHVVLWGFNHFPDTLSAGGMLVWIKRSDAAFGQFLSDAEVAWVKGIKGVYCYRDIWHAIACEREHPTEKPVGLMEWSIVQSKAKADTPILDPFCGSGTTLVAAKKLGRHFLGFEISEQYCEIARRRLAEIDRQPSLFDAKPQQEEMF